MYWSDKPYHSLNYALKQRFGEKVYKLSLNAGMTCPNRDGTLDDRGCIFCSRGGSGDFAGNMNHSIAEQIAEQKQLLSHKKTGNKYIAYFQAYTNTYASVSQLSQIYMPAITSPDIVGLSIATRPDCLETEKIEMLAALNKQKPVWMELGLQTIHEDTAHFIRRGYSLACFEEAVYRLHNAGLEIIVHIILGLPGESEKQILETISYLNTLPIQGVKLQMLHVLKDTDLDEIYKRESFPLYTLEEYTDILIKCIERLSPEIVIHRITGDGPKNSLTAPLWSGYKKNVLNYIHHEFKIRNTYQGKF